MSIGKDVLCGALGTQTRKAAGSALENRIDKPVPEEHTVPCDLIREVCIKHIIRAIFLFSGEGWGGVGRGYTEGVRMAEKAALIRWVLMGVCAYVHVPSRVFGEAKGRRGNGIPGRGSTECKYMLDLLPWFSVAGWGEGSGRGWQMHWEVGRCQNTKVSHGL